MQRVEPKARNIRVFRLPGRLQQLQDTHALPRAIGADAARLAGEEGGGSFRFRRACAAAIPLGFLRQYQPEARMLHRVKDLSPEQKLAVEALLGRSMAEDESVSVKALTPPRIQASRLSPESRQAALERLNRYFERLDGNRRPMTDADEEAVITEALRSARPGFSPIE